MGKIRKQVLEKLHVVSMLLAIEDVNEMAVTGDRTQGHKPVYLQVFEAPSELELCREAREKAEEGLEVERFAYGPSPALSCEHSWPNPGVLLLEISWIFAMSFPLHKSPFFVTAMSLINIIRGNENID